MAVDNEDFAIIFIAALLSAVFITQAGFFIPAAITLCYAFMSIRLDDTSVMDYIKCAVSFFLTSQQEYRWGGKNEQNKKQKKYHS